jgi:hypothetical protein
MVGDTRTFRHPLGQRWLPVLLALGCIVAFWFGLTHPSRRVGGKWRDLSFSVVAAAGTFWFLYAAWIQWSTKVTLDAEGVGWNAGSQRGSLRWDQIDGIALGQRATSPEWSLIEKGTGIGHRLPLMPRALFLALRERLKPISPDADKHFQ